NEPRGQHAAFEDFGAGRRSVENYRGGSGHEIGNREIARAGAKPGMNATYRPLICIISAPSGSGKSTLVNELLKLVPNLNFSISYTTRALRGSEQNGKQYHFVSSDEFERMIDADEFLEYANFDGNYYGTSRQFLKDAGKKGHDLLLDIDVQGAEQIKQKLTDAVSIFVLPPDRKTLELRLRKRSEDAEEVIA